MFSLNDGLQSLRELLEPFKFLRVIPVPVVDTGDPRCDVPQNCLANLLRATHLGKQRAACASQVMGRPVRYRQTLTHPVFAGFAVRLLAVNLCLNIGLLDMPTGMPARKEEASGIGLHPCAHHACRPPHQREAEIRRALPILILGLTFKKSSPQNAIFFADVTCVQCANLYTARRRPQVQG